MKLLQVWIDTDGGVDDALGLVCALAGADVSVGGISTVYGNVTPRKAARNAALIQSMMTRDQIVPVYPGAASPIIGTWRHARHIHGEDGLGGEAERHPVGTFGKIVQTADPSNSVDAIGRFCDQHAGSANLIGFGPLTNFAHALDRRPACLARIGSLTVMGGVFDVPPARRGGSEFNFSSDMEAVRRLLATDLPLTVIPLDVCRQVILRRHRLDQIACHHGGSLTRLLARSHMHYMDGYRAREGIDGCYPHDALTIASIMRPDFFRFEMMTPSLDWTGVFPGLMRAQGGRRPVRIATAIDPRRALDWIEAQLMAV
jgi:inosine-uridine nucleoside N-ribohydrolase